MPFIRSHTLTLTDGIVTLRPMTDEDLPLLYRWNGDEDVLHFSEGDVEPYTPEEVDSIYQSLSKKADCFIVEAEDGTPIGECRLQPMKAPFPPPLGNSADCRRVDIVIGEKDYWGKEYGSRAIGLLCRQVFERTSCSHLFSCGILDYNERCRKAFEKNGFKLFESIPADGDDVPGQMTLFKGSINKIF